MHEEAGSLSHNTTSNTQLFVPTFKILGAVVPEKSLTKVCLCITLERWEKGNMEKKAKLNVSMLVFFPTI